MKKHEMRNLKTNDIFKITKILRKIGVKDKVKDILVTNPNMDNKEFGMQIMMTVFEQVDLAQDEINDFLGGLVNLSAKKFGELDIEESMEIIQQFKELKGLRSFFGLASK